MKWLKYTFIILLIIVTVLGIVAAHYYYTVIDKKKPSEKGIAKNIKSNENYAKQQKCINIVRKLNAFIKKNDYNNQYLFLIDMSIASGKKRLFIYDFKKNTIVNSGIVAHGRCNESRLSDIRYSNEVGSGCTSLGKYKIGNQYTGRFGLAYKLHGLDSTNSNVYERFVVLHSHSCVPEKEVAPYPICQSDGCPTIAPAFLTLLAKIIDQEKKPILMYIYE